MHGKPACPVVTVTWAQSAAGAIARADGTPLRISGPQSMVLTHQLRAVHDAILVGIQTVINDDPLLSVRLPPQTQLQPLTQPQFLPHPRAVPQPQPVVLDSHLRFPPGARLLARADRKPWLFHLDDPGGRAGSLQERGARIFPVGEDPGDLDLYGVLRSLGAAGVSSLMVEGGEQLATVAAEQPAAALNGLREPLAIDQAEWHVLGWKDSARAVLAAALGNENTSRSARETINELGARGHVEFRDLLRSSS